jgi:ADP-heptose:LPS heptosyltransferase
MTLTFPEAMGDFSETAALLPCLDLVIAVIAVDAGVAHLAGAMGMPVWVILPFTPDWRWLLARDDSPWYPTARLFRQSRPDDWSEAVAHVAAELRKFFARTNAGARPSGDPAAPPAPAQGAPKRRF